MRPYWLEDTSLYQLRFEIMIKLSVIIPVYKVEKYIERCLRSIIDQERSNYAIECILVDDCSPDNSMAIVQKVIDEFHGSGVSFISIRHTENQGLSIARNTGILAAHGDYILFVDSDDYIPKNSYSYLIKYAIQYPDVEVIESNAFDRKKGTPINPYLSSIMLLEDKEQIYSKNINFEFSIYVWNKMTKRSVIIEHQLFFEKGIIHEDILWSYMLYSSVTSVLLLPRNTYIYECNPFSISNTTRNRINNYVRSHLYICRKLFEMPPITRNKKNNLFVEYHIFIYTFLFRAIEIDNHQPVSKELRQSLNMTKKQMITECVKDHRLLLALFGIMMFKPFSQLLRMPLFRRLYYKISRIVKICSKMTDIFHTNRYYNSHLN